MTDEPDGRFPLRVRRIGIDTYDEPVVFLRADSAASRAEGFETRSRVRLRHNGRSIVATLNVVTSGIVDTEEAGLSEAAWRLLACREGDHLHAEHAEPVDSFSAVRGKIYGRPLETGAIDAIVADVVSGLYAPVEIAAFLTACAGPRLSIPEAVALTRAMLAAGQRLTWPGTPIVDKHSIGGLPGNRTTPIVVSVVAAAGLVMPKTSSRAITSPAGTADTMETLAPVDLDIAAMRRVVEREGGCIVWGGGMGLSPADDILIRIERVLDFDSDGQLAASVLSKKAAAGSTHVIVDMPVGPTAKVRSVEQANRLAHMLMAVGEAMGLSVRPVRTDGTAPVGRGIGPALEARDVLQVLANDKDAPDDLRARALLMAGEVLEMGGRAPKSEGQSLARRLLEDGSAARKFDAIREAQGGARTPPVAAQTRPILAERAGLVSAIDNRRIARIAKLSGAPRARSAGVDLHVRLGDRVSAGQPLATLHAESPGELDYASEYVAAAGSGILIERDA